MSALRNKDRDLKLFGANGHRYQLHAPCTEDVIVNFERTHVISLPKDYRGFLLEVGNGGAGPFYGVFKLGEMDGARGDKPWKEGEFVGILRNPWPHRAEWNLSDEEVEEPECLSDDELDQAMEAREKKVLAEARIAGAFPTCHQGCSLRDWLEVTGPEAGQVWHDGRADHQGLRPYERGDGRRLTFLDWYLDWLDEGLRNLTIQLPR